MTTQAKHDYQQLYQQATNAPEAFWQQQAAKLHWYKAPQQILLQQDAVHYQWFSDGVLNTAYLALDNQVEQGRGEQTALIYDSPVTSTKQRFSYRELRDEVAQFAGVLKNLGVQKGDRVVIYMPMIPKLRLPCWRWRVWAPCTRWYLVAFLPTSWRCELMMPSPKWYLAPRAVLKLAN